jgi:hypothetical protein
MLMRVRQQADTASKLKLKVWLKKAAECSDKKDHEAKLDSVRAEASRAGEDMIELAERSVNLQAIA